MSLRPLIVCMLLAAVPSAQAQGMPTTDVTVTIENAPETLAAGGNATVRVTVEFQISNVVCPANEDVTVDVAFEATPSVTGVTALLLEDSLTYTIPMGAETGAGYEESQSTEINIEVGLGVMNATQEYTVTATFDGGSVCQAAGNAPAAEGSAAFTLATQAAPPPTNTTDEGGGGGGGGGIPGPGLPLTLLAVLAVALFLRKR